jgi:hypothetical protein
MDYQGILSNADKLRKSSGFKVAVSNQVRDFLYRINSIITDAHSIGTSNVTVKMPINFDSPDENISNMEMQTHIYYCIVKELERLNYKVKLQFLKKHTELYIEWTVKVDKSELEQMQQKLMSLSRSP